MPLLAHRYRRRSTFNSSTDSNQELVNYLRMNLDLQIGLFSVLRPHQHSIGYTGDGFYGSKDPTNSIKVLKENLQKKITQRTKKTQNTHAYTQNGKIQHTIITQQVP